jgi:hypothetical protein
MEISLDAYDTRLDAFEARFDIAKASLCVIEPEFELSTAPTDLLKADG